MKQTVNSRCREYGGTIVETFFCLYILLLVLFGLLQIFQWSVAKILCEYSAFYVVKGEALGYNRGIVERAGRVALTGVSGENLSRVPLPAVPTRRELEDRAADYMMYSTDGIYGVDYEYWDPAVRNRDTPYIWINYDPPAEYSEGRVSVQKMPLLQPEFKPIFGVDNVNIPEGRAVMYDYAHKYLDE